MFSIVMGIRAVDRSGWLENSRNLYNIPLANDSRLSIGTKAVYEFDSEYLNQALGFTAVVSVNKLDDPPRHMYGITEKSVQVSLEDGNLLQTFTEVCKFIAAHMRPKRGVLLYGDNFTLNLTLAVAYLVRCDRTMTIEKALGYLIYRRDHPVRLPRWNMDQIEAFRKVLNEGLKESPADQASTPGSAMR